MKNVYRENNVDTIWSRDGRYPNLDYVGKVIGRLTVIEWLGRDKHSTNFWLCLCSCNNQVVVEQTSLKKETTNSCGCLSLEVHTKHGYASRGKGLHPLYIVFQNMKSRCYNTKNKRYEHYGGRGITICDEWLQSHKAFIEWGIHNGYKEGLTIERINNDGDYCPENCCFIERKDQANNKRSNILLTYKGRTQNIAQWAREVGINWGTLYGRIQRGWSVEDAILKPVNTKVA